jgi:heptosyltransferase-2
MGLSSLKALSILYPDAKLYYALPSEIVPLYKTIFWPNLEVIGLDQRPSKVDFTFELVPANYSALKILWSKIVAKGPYGILKKNDDGIALIQQDLDGLFDFLSAKGIYNGERPDYRDLSPELSLKGALHKKSRIILGITSESELKKYPLSHYAQICQMIKGAFPDIKIWIPIDKSITDEELKKYGLFNYADITGWKMDELPRHFGESLLYLGNDNDFKHLAVACNVRTYTLFRMESPKVEHPYERVKHPYFFREEPEEGSEDQEIAPKAIFEAVRKDLSIMTKTFKLLNKTGYTQ